MTDAFRWVVTEYMLLLDLFTCCAYVMSFNLVQVYS